MFLARAMFDWILWYCHRRYAESINTRWLGCVRWGWALSTVVAGI